MDGCGVGGYTVHERYIKINTAGTLINLCFIITVDTSGKYAVF